MPNATSCVCGGTAALFLFFIFIFIFIVKRGTWLIPSCRAIRAELLGRRSRVAIKRERERATAAKDRLD